MAPPDSPRQPNTLNEEKRKRACIALLNAVIARELDRQGNATKSIPAQVASLDMKETSDNEQPNIPNT